MLTLWIRPSSRASTLIGLGLLLTLNAAGAISNEPVAGKYSAPPAAAAAIPPLPLLTKTVSIYRLARAKARGGYPVGIHVVAPRVLPEPNVLGMPDGTAGLYTTDPAPANNLPTVGLLAAVTVLALLLTIALLRITRLHRPVERRMAKLQMQIEKRARAEHRRAMEQERARIARDLHDELGADITEIGMLSTRAICTTSSAEERDECLAQLAGKTGQMVSALEEIVWAIDPQHDSLASVVSYCSFYADRFLGLANIRLQIDSSPGVDHIVMDAGERHQFFLVFKEALTNVVNHSGATEVRLSFRMEGGELRVTLMDNGRGLALTPRTNGQNGTANMQLRIEKLRGRFEIAGEAGHGTTLKFTAPLT